MKFLRSVKGCTREDGIRNESIQQEMNIQPIIQHAGIYKSKWKDHLAKMLRERLPKQALNYQPTGKEVWEDQGLGGD